MADSWLEGFLKMIEEFNIDGVVLTAELDHIKSKGASFAVNSVPFPYKIEWLDNALDPAAVINADETPIVLIDRHIRSLWFKDLRSNIPTFESDASEANKTIHSAIKFSEFMESVNTTKSNMVYVVGGGIMQDIGAFACAMYKRGIPWTYLPTTLLGMVDSCIGGKTGLNHNSTKNLLALFSAPRKIIQYLPFLDTLPSREIVAGFGEALRLHTTGGPGFFSKFEDTIDQALDGNKSATHAIISGALSVKRAVVEEDEFERSLRRSMNYGHSIGHAIEALTNFAFPHGMAISLGTMVENMIAVTNYGLSLEEAKRINRQAIKLVDEDAKSALANIDFGHINDVLMKDKKTLGKTLKIAVPISIGQMQFHDFHLNDASPANIRSAFKRSDLI